MAEFPESKLHPNDVAVNTQIPRLYYFNARGRAEIIRLIFAYAEVCYEDVRFRHQPHAVNDFEEFKRKKKLPFDQVPVLEIDGLLLAQSQAIVRFLARKYGLAGESELEHAQTDMIACGAEDLRQKFNAVLFANPGENLEMQITLFRSETCPRWAFLFERLLSDNGGEYFVASGLTYADLTVYDTMSTITWRVPGAFDDFKLLLAHTARIEALPQISKWLKTRPTVPV